MEKELVGCYLKTPMYLWFISAVEEDPNDVFLKLSRPGIKPGTECTEKRLFTKNKNSLVLPPNQQIVSPAHPSL